MVSYVACRASVPSVSGCDAVASTPERGSIEQGDGATMAAPYGRRIVKTDETIAMRQTSGAAEAGGLVGKAYEAAAEPALWPVFLETFARATDNEGTLIWLQGAADGSARMREPEMAFIANVRHPPEYMQSYAEYYSRINVLLSGIDAIAEGSLMSSSAMLSDAELHPTEYYNDWLKPQGIGYCMGGPILRRGNDVAMFSTQRLLQHGPFPREEFDGRGVLRDARTGAEHRPHAFETGAREDRLEPSVATGRAVGPDDARPPSRRAPLTRSIRLSASSGTPRRAAGQHLEPAAPLRR
jgi:hypothetical protein